MARSGGFSRPVCGAERLKWSLPACVFILRSCLDAAGKPSEDVAEDTDRNVFIVRIWREPRETGSAPVECRGVVEHVASGQRRFFRQLGDLDAFIQSLSCFEEQITSRR